MLLGIEKVVLASEAKVGKFYLRYFYNNPPQLFQCIEKPESDGENRRALFINAFEEHPLVIENLPDQGPFVELPQVYVRIDAPSVSGTSFTSSLRSGMMVVSENTPYVAAIVGWRGYQIVDLSTGKLTPLENNFEWASFATWQLVIEQAGEEIPIASFPNEETA